MTSFVRKRGKTWTYYFEYKLDGKNKQVSKGGFAKKSDAKVALAEALTEYENSGLVDSNITLDAFFKYFMETGGSKLKIGTRNRYNELYTKYLLPQFGAHKMRDITTLSIDRFISGLGKKYHVTDTTAQGVYIFLKSLFRRAIKLKLIKNNPCDGLTMPKRSDFEAEILTEGEIGEILSVLNTESEYDYKFMIGFLCTLEVGFRRGELAGLEWKDVDFDNNRILIRNNFIYSNGHVYIETPKTTISRRAIIISDTLASLLKALKERHGECKKELGRFYTENVIDEKQYDFVFRWDDGKYIHPMYWTSKVRKIITACGIKKRIRFHDLRHTNASLLLQEGVDMKTIKDRLGHVDIQMLMKIYGHTTDKMQEKAGSVMSGILYGEDH